MFGTATRSGERSAPLRERLTAAAEHLRLPVLLLYAANDYSVRLARVWHGSPLHGSNKRDAFLFQEDSVARGRALRGTLDRIYLIPE